MDYLWTPWRYAYLVDADQAGKRGRKGVPPALAAWPGDCHCVFCNLIAATGYAVEHGMPAMDADRAANIVFRGQHSFICLNAFPYSSGHVMIVPYAHQDSLASLELAAALEMMTLAQRTEAVLRQVYSPQGINMGMNLGQAAGAGIAEHLHMHALPRWLGDSNFMTVIAETRVLPETLDITWQRLQEAFRAKSL
jgi:ATP adenylyltransferase